jgi:hypothetical protein
MQVWFLNFNVPTQSMACRQSSRVSCHALPHVRKDVRLALCYSSSGLGFWFCTRLSATSIFVCNLEISAA